MSHNKPIEHWKREANAHTRRTMLFNERTDRSLHVELSQLERNRQEIVRDLRKIKQVKGALKKQLSSALEASSRPRRRSRSDTSIDAYSSHVLLPNIATNTGRSRLQSDIGPVDRLLKDDLIATDRLLKKDRVATEKMPGTSDKMLEFSRRGEDNRNADQAQEALEEGHLFPEKSKQNQSEFTYKTNQERREDHMIKSRFNQLGSKYVGRQMVGRRSRRASNKLPKALKQNRAKQSSQAKEAIRDNDNETGAKQSGDGGRDFPDAAAQDSLSSEMATLDINNNRREGTTSETDETLSDSLVRCIPDIRIQPHYWPQETLPNTCQRPEEQTHPVTNKDAFNMPGTSGTLQRKTSTCSLVSSQQILPKIPMELTSKRQSRGSVCLERAFVDCQEVRAGNMDLKTERKRRFARLVDMVIKQKKVIRAWEPMLALVGDIHSSDEEV